jgi:hypothetical protein
METLTASARPSARAAQQILIRLPYNLACQLAKSVPPRGRNQYVVDVLTRELESTKAAKEAQLIAACEAMNAYEAANPAFVAEGKEWLDAVLTEDHDDDDFDPVEFERGWNEAKALREASGMPA